MAANKWENPSLEMDDWHASANVTSTVIYSSCSHFSTTPRTLGPAPGRPNESAANSTPGVSPTWSLGIKCFEHNGLHN